MDTIVKSYSPPAVIADEPRLPDPKPNEFGAESNPIEEPVEDSGMAVLNALGIDDEIRNLPPQDQDMLSEVGQYVSDIIRSKGGEPTATTFKNTLDGLKYEMGLDSMATPQVVLDRIGGVVKAWKGLTFIKNPQEKRSIFMKLARMDSSTDMNKLVFQEMEKHSVWQ